MEDDEYWDAMRATSQRILDRERIIYKSTLENHQLDRELILDRKRVIDRVPSDVRQLWVELEAVQRQQKALWLRVLLDDYEF
jgi:hypothetical protein